MVTKRFLSILILGLVLIFGAVGSVKAAGGTGEKCHCICQSGQDMGTATDKYECDNPLCAIVATPVSRRKTCDPVNIQACTCLDGTPIPGQMTTDECAASCAGHGAVRPQTTGDDSDGNGGTVTTESSTLQNPLGNNVKSVPDLAHVLIKVIISLLGVVSLVMFIYAGLLWLTAMGDKTKIQKGKDTMVWAVAGLLLVFSSYIILNYVFTILSF